MNRYISGVYVTIIGDVGNDIFTRMLTGDTKWSDGAICKSRAKLPIKTNGCYIISR